MVDTHIKTRVTRHSIFTHSRLSSLLQILLCGSALLTACADGFETNNEINAADCPQGKCDRVSDNVRELYSDMKRMNLDDLVSLGAGLATDEVNTLLSELPFIDLKLSETSLFGLQERVLFGETMINGIQALQAGLTSSLGEEAFATQINALRLKTLQNSDYEVFAESSFKLGGALNTAWALDHNDDLLGSLGFDLSPSMEAMIIAPYRNISEAVVNSPLSALKEMQGFVLPRDMNDITRLAPGSSVTMSGKGVVGMNLNVGVPLVATAISQYLNLSAKFSGGARISLSGNLDVQLVRGDDQTAYLDVGLSEQKVKHFSVAVHSAYGIEGLPTAELSIGGLKVDLAKVLEEALERQLNDKLGLFDAQRSTSSLQGRVSVARFEFNLAQATPSLTQAFQQAMKGDIRLAQALAIRDDSGIQQHFQLTKDFQIDSKYLGFRLLSMRFFRSTEEARGSVHIGTQGERQEILYDEIDRKGGLFFTERGSSWRQTTSTINNGLGQSESLNNARLILTEHDNFLSKDQINDHFDALLAYFYGDEAVFGDIGVICDEISEFADHACGNRPTHDASRRDRDRYENCVEDLPINDQMRNLVEQAHQRSSNHKVLWKAQDFASNSSSAQSLAEEILATRIGISSIHDAPNVGLTGPNGTIVTQVRFSDEAVNLLMAQDAPQRFSQTLMSVMALMDLDRDDDIDDRFEEREDYLDNKSRRISDVKSSYSNLVDRFQQYSAVAELTWKDGTPVSEEVGLLLVPEDPNQRISIASIAQLKGELVGSLYGALIEAAKRLGEPDTLLIGYALLHLVPPSMIELMINAQFETDHRGGYSMYDIDLYGQGNASFINAGMFDLNALLGAKEL
ncbi:MAG: hypothetical protein CMH49_06630 [Myxococcales bacterium]|nr:hypothetical protein [Myxococcales bacterium]